MRKVLLVVILLGGCGAEASTAALEQQNSVCPKPDSFCNWHLTDADSWCTTLCGRPAFCGFVEDDGTGHCIQLTAPKLDADPE